MMRTFLFSLPLVAVFAGAGIGKWVSVQSTLLPSAEAKFGVTASRLLLGSDNPSLILGELLLLICFVMLWKGWLRGINQCNPPADAE